MLAGNYTKIALINADCGLKHLERFLEVYTSENSLKRKIPLRHSFNFSTKNFLHFFYINEN